MIDADPTRKSVERPPGPVSLWGILAESLRLYARHWQPFTRVLLLPMLYIMIGAYSCLIITQLFVKTVTERYMDLAQQHLLLFLLVVMIIALGTLSLFFKGFWQYAVYWASLNVNANEVIEGRPAEIQPAYQHLAKQRRKAYKMLLLVYGLLPGIGLIGCALCIFIGVTLAALQNPLAAGGVLLLGLGLFGLAVLLWVILAIPLSLIFQIIVLQPSDLQNPLPILKESFRLVMRRPWTTLGLQFVLFLLTNYLLTMPVAFLFRLLHLTAPLDALHHWIVQLLISSMASDAGSDPQLQQLVTTMHGMASELAHGWSDTTVMLILTALLLPLGTFAFTLLYRALIATVPARAASAESTDSL